MHIYDKFIENCCSQQARHTPNLQWIKNNIIYIKDTIIYILTLPSLLS